VAQVARIFAGFGLAGLGEISWPPTDAAEIARAADAEVCVSDLARNYIKQLPSGFVPPKVRHFLFFLADYHNVQKGCAWPGIETLAEDIDQGVRQIQRWLKIAQTAKLISYEPGLGRGKLGRFRFLELEKGVSGDIFSTLKGDRKADKKGDISNSAIRKNHEPRNQSQNQHASRALKTWLSIKSELQNEFPEATWIPPIYLLRTMGDCLLLAMPPNGEMMARAKSCQELQQKLRTSGYSGAVFTHYPDDYELERIRVEFPQHYELLFDALKRRRPPERACG
jgi:hypothetical protein